MTAEASDDSTVLCPSDGCAGVGTHASVRRSRRSGGGDGSSVRCCVHRVRAGASDHGYGPGGRSSVRRVSHRRRTAVVLNGGPSVVGSSVKAGRWALGQRTEFGDVIKQWPVSERWDGSRWAKSRWRMRLRSSRSRWWSSAIGYGRRVVARTRPREATPDRRSNDGTGRVAPRRQRSRGDERDGHACLGDRRLVSSRHSGRRRCGRQHLGASDHAPLGRVGAWTRVPAPLPLPVDAFDGDFRLNAIAASGLMTVGGGLRVPVRAAVVRDALGRLGLDRRDLMVPDAPSDNALFDVAAVGAEVWGCRYGGRSCAAPSVGWIRLGAHAEPRLRLHDKPDQHGFGRVGCPHCGIGLQRFSAQSVARVLPWSPPNSWWRSAPPSGPSAI